MDARKEPEERTPPDNFDISSLQEDDLKTEVVSVRLDTNTLKVLDEEAKANRMTRPDVIRQALQKELHGGNDSELITRSLTQQRNHLARLGDHVDILMETLLTFVSVWFERRAPLATPEEQQQAARNLQVQYETFIRRLKHTLSGESRVTGLYTAVADCMPELSAEQIYTPSSERGDDNA